MTPNADYAHRVEWRLDRDVVVGSLVCDAPEGADCRLVCKEGCESWPCGHDLEDNGCCNAVEWIDQYDLAECHWTNGSEVVRDGPVHVWWDGDSWLWHYPPPNGRSES
jgi:hypothetical protein